MTTIRAIRKDISQKPKTRLDADDKQLLATFARIQDAVLSGFAPDDFSDAEKAKLLSLVCDVVTAAELEDFLGRAKSRKDSRGLTQRLVDGDRIEVDAFARREAEHTAALKKQRDRIAAETRARRDAKPEPQKPFSERVGVKARKGSFSERLHSLID